METEEEFEEIIQNAIRKAEQVDCPQADYYAGLKTMLITLREHVNMVRDEIGAED